MNRYAIGLAAWVLAAAACGDAQDATVVRVNYVTVVVDAEGAETPWAEGVHYIADDGRYRHDEAVIGRSPTSSYRLPAEDVNVTLNHSLLEAVGSGLVPPMEVAAPVGRGLPGPGLQPPDATGHRRADARSAAVAWGRKRRGRDRILVVSTPDDAHGSARVSADPDRRDLVHGRRPAARNAGDVRAARSVGAGHLRRSRSDPLRERWRTCPGVSSPAGQIKKPPQLLKGESSSATQTESSWCVQLPLDGCVTTQCVHIASGCRVLAPSFKPSVFNRDCPTCLSPMV